MDPRFLPSRYGSCASYLGHNARGKNCHSLLYVQRARLIPLVRGEIFGTHDRREELSAQRRDLHVVSSLLVVHSAELSRSIFVTDCNSGRGGTGAEQRAAER